MGDPGPGAMSLRCKCGRLFPRVLRHATLPDQFAVHGIVLAGFFLPVPCVVTPASCRPPVAIRVSLLSCVAVAGLPMPCGFSSWRPCANADVDKAMPRIIVSAAKILGFMMFSSFQRLINAMSLVVRPGWRGKNGPVIRGRLTKRVEREGQSAARYVCHRVPDVNPGFSRREARRRDRFERNSGLAEGVSLPRKALPLVVVNDQDFAVLGVDVFRRGVDRYHSLSSCRSRCHFEAAAA